MIGQTVLLPNFKAVGQIQTEFHSLKFEKLDVCIRPFFTKLIRSYIHIQKPQMEHDYLPNSMMRSTIIINFQDIYLQSYFRRFT